eukprot:3012055-Lingulodinium_polyedra.AAC.1
MLGPDDAREADAPAGPAPPAATKPRHRAGLAKKSRKAALSARVEAERLARAARQALGKRPAEDPAEQAGASGRT